MARTYRIFLSSTGRDLQAHRDAVHAALSAIDVVKVIRMEDFAADHVPPAAVCEKYLSSCDILVALVGFTYGSAPEGSNRSYTQLEYDHAIARGIHPLLFVAPEGTPLPSYREPDAIFARQEAFRQSLGGHTPAPPGVWSSPDCLARAAAQSVEAYIREQIPKVTLPSQDEYIRNLERELRSLRDEVRRIGERIPAWLARRQEEVARKIRDPDASYAELREAVEEIAQELLGIATDAQREAAHQAVDEMGRGTFDRATALLDDIAAAGDDREGGAVYCRAKIASLGFRLSEARALFERAAELQPDADKRLVNAAMACWSDGDFRGAMRYAERAIERAERRGIAAEIVRASICLGTARVAMGDQTGAGEPLRHAYQQAQGLEKCSKEHFNALVTYGHYLAQMMDLPAAERVLRQAVEVSNEVKGRDSLYYATAIATISPLLRLMGQLPEADALLSVAADITSKKLGRRNPAYSRIIAQQALNRSIQMRHVEADTSVSEALGIDRDTLGENHPIYASTLAIQSQILLNQQKLHEAETGFRRAEALMIERVGPNHAEVGSIRLALGHALAMSRRFGEALPYLEAGEQTLRSAFGPAHPQARQAAMVLQQVRAACGFQNIGGAIHRFFTGK